MNGRSGSGLVMKIYLGVFFLYLYLPLAVMAAATFNSSRFPTVTPWLGTTLKWFPALYDDERMWGALWNSVLVGIAVILVSIPLGVSAALFLNGLQSRARTFIYAVMVSPLLTPGVIMSVRIVGVMVMEDEAGGDEKLIGVPVEIVGTVRTDEHHRCRTKAASEIPEQLSGRAVGPMQIFEHEQRRYALRQSFEQPEQLFEQCAGDDALTRRRMRLGE